MRGLFVLLASTAALVAAAAPGGAALQPIRHGADELERPRVRPGTVAVPQRRRASRVTVLVRLAQPPLARYHARRLQSATAARKLNVATAGARAHLARLARAQRAAAVQIRRTIPGARVHRRYRVVLNALAVDLPARRLPRLVRLPLATRVYPSVRYTLGLNASPTVIGAGPAGGVAGARGEGMKIAIVDDGVDHLHPFFDPAGYEYPAGYPKGHRAYTTPKVIVARAFGGFGSGRRGRLPVDRSVSFHGTHVAGIAAGNAGTDAPAGDDHPAVPDLSGVAPRAWIGNYRVFTVPTPIGHVANTPEIVAAFEAVVTDGMDVLNFSGGGPETEPANDAVLEAVRNVAAAGVVPVIAAGNDRDDFGRGTVGSPGTAAEAISVAATSSTQVFGAVLEVLAEGAPEALRRIPLRPAAERPLRFAHAARDPLVDVGTITGTDGKPVDRLLCGPPGRPNEGPSTLPPGSLAGAIALASRGVCTFVSKARRARAAGAVGIVLVDNRAGEANVIPIALPLPAGMIADLDGARLRAFLAGTGGRTLVRVADGPLRIETGRSGIVTSFSSGGPTPFGHDLKPDVSAPGGQILSATLAHAGGPYAVFDGTSMATPHVSGAAALLLQRHRGWTPHQVKSALVASAGPAWANTARTEEAPVVLEGGGLANVARADDPRLFTQPVSLSFPDLDVTRGAVDSARLVRLQDADGGAGTWQVELRPQAATAGAALDLPPLVQLAPGGEATLVAIARAGADAQPGENYGFVVLRSGDVVRRLPYFFLVTRPALASVGAQPLRRRQVGDTRGESRVARYRYPTAPFGPPPDYTGPPMEQVGAERLYEVRIPEPVVNFGVSVIASSEGSAPDPWLLGSKDENDVEGYAGTPVNVNSFTVDYRVDVGAAGAVFARPKTYYVSVDAGRDQFTGRSLAGRYVLQAWVNDLVPPRIVPLTTRVSAGRPTLVARVVDRPTGRSSGVDPFSLVAAYGRALVGAAAYDPVSGLAVFPLPGEAPRLRAGRRAVTLMAGDFQETKNVATPGGEVLPNTAFRRVSLRVVAGPTVTWVRPERGACVRGRARLLVVAGSTARVRSVRFLDGRRRIATVRRGTAGLYAATWQTRRAARGRHVLRAVVTDVRGRTASSSRPVRVCR